MGNLVVKSNAFIGASYGLSLVQQRLILLAILQARETNDINEAIAKTLIIHASDYMNIFGVDRTTAYQALEDAANGLYESEYRYIRQHENGKKEIHRERFVSGISYSDGLGLVRIKFTPETVPLIVGLSENFTKYEIEQVSKLSSQYSLRLYEVLCQWRAKGTTTISLEELRFKFGLGDNQYLRMDNFKRKILDFSVSEINNHTDLSVDYKQNKQGRNITGFTFTIKIKQKTKPKTITTAKKTKTPETPVNATAKLEMTDKQRRFFAAKLSHLSECSRLPGGQESYDALASFIAQDLTREDRASFYAPLLQTVGYK